MDYRQKYCMMLRPLKEKVVSHHCVHHKIIFDERYIKIGKILANLVMLLVIQSARNNLHYSNFSDQ